MQYPLLYRLMRWKQFWFILLWVVIIGVRVWLTFSQEFWEDELWSLYFGATPESYVQMLVHPPDDRPPVFHMFTRLLVGWRIEGHWLRLPSLFAAIATIWMVFGATRRFSSSWGVATVCAAGTSLVLIDASWQLREYAFLGLVAALQVSLWLRWLERAEQSWYPGFEWWRNWALVSFIGVALSYVYLPFLTALLVSWLVLLVWNWIHRQISGLQFAQYIVAVITTSVPTVLMAAIYLFSAQFAKISSTTTWIPQPSFTSVTSLIVTLSNWHSNLWEYRVVLPLEQQRLALLVIFWLAVFGVTQWTLWQQQRRQLVRFNWWALGVMVLNIGSVVYASYFLNVSVFLPRFFTPLAVVAALVWATSLVALDNTFQPSFRTSMRGLGILAGSLMFWAFFSQVYKVGVLYAPEALSLAQLSENIRAAYRPGDQLVFLPEHYQKIMPLYYFLPHQYPDAFTLSTHTTASVSTKDSTARFWSGKQLFVVVANLLIDPNSNFYEPGGYEAYSLEQLERYLQHCAEPSPVLVIGSEYSYYHCVMQ